MALIRFGVSLEAELLKKFDHLCDVKGCKNRSEAIRDLIRDKLVETEWGESKGEVTGVISIVYDHHKRQLVEKLTSIQHHYAAMKIMASQHIDLDHHNCLEVMITKGKAKDVKGFASRIRSSTGVKHGQLVMTTTGKEIR